MHYSPLDTNKHQIRLLHLTPSSDRRKTIVCHFSIISLSEGDQVANYEALSYAWGAPVLNRSIRLEGAHYAVTANLKVILRALRHAEHERVLWVDAICIDQHNIAERSHQVSRMNDIYSKASNVIIWLGEPRSDAALAFRFLEEFGRNQIEPLPMDDEKRNMEQTALAVRSLLTRSWWTRIWTAQEWILATQTIFQSGPYTLKGETLLGCLSHYQRHVKATDCCDMHLTSDFLFRLGDSLQPILALHLVKLSYVEQDFSYSLGLLRTREATDLRDKVYGVLALAVNRYSGLLRADYLLPVEIVYEQLTIALIERTRRLDIFSHIIPNQPRNLDVPSFVPDWTIEPGKEYSNDWTVRFLSNSRYDACLSKPAEFKIRPKVLYIKGLVIDVVKNLTVRRLGSYKKTTLYRNQLLNEMYKLAEPAEAVYYEDERQTRKQAFWLTVCGGLEALPEANSSGSETFVDNFETFVKWEEWFRGPRTSYQTSDVRLRAVTDSIASVSKGRTFCTTEQGRIGWVPKNSIAGDAIAVLTGGQLPIVLRSCGDHHTVVGDAYVHGVMQGEAFESANDLECIELH